MGGAGVQNAGFAFSKGDRLSGGLIGQAKDGDVSVLQMPLPGRSIFSFCIGQGQEINVCSALQAFGYLQTRRASLPIYEN
jgi:hypothetical protein